MITFPPMPNASEFVRGALSILAQRLKGKKTFINDPDVEDTLIVGSDSPVHEVEVEEDTFDLLIHPLQLGGIGEEGDVDNLFNTAGLRYYEVFKKVLSLSMFEGLSIDLEEDEGETTIVLRADQVNVPSPLSANSIEVGGQADIGGNLQVNGSTEVAGSVDASGGFFVNGSPIGGGGGSGVDTLAAVGTAPNANGASISGSTLTLQPASDEHPGVTSNVAQTMKGAKRGLMVELTIDGSQEVHPDFALGNFFYLVVDDDCLFIQPTNRVPGQSGVIIVEMDSSGSWAVNFESGGSFYTIDGTPPSVSSDAEAITVLSYFVDHESRVLITGAGAFETW